MSSENSLNQHIKYKHKEFWEAKRPRGRRSKTEILDDGTEIVRQMDELRLGEGGSEPGPQPLGSQAEHSPEKGQESLPPQGSQQDRNLALD